MAASSFAEESTSDECPVDRPSPLDEIESNTNTLLIFLVRDSPFIYDLKDRRHKDRNLIERTWTTIGSELGISAEDARVKWSRLRNNYGKALERRKKRIPSGSGASKNPRPWIYEAEMDFLRPHLNTYRPSSSSMSHTYKRALETQPEASEETAEVEPGASGIAHAGVIEEEEEQTQGQPRRKKKKSDTEMSELDSAMLKYITNSLNKQEDDPAVSWFKSLLPIINSLSPLQYLEFQGKVIEELKKLLSNES